jgi:C1A family cysteine protease
LSHYDYGIPNIDGTSRRPPSIAGPVEAGVSGGVFVAKHFYGWVPDIPDHRDFWFAAPVENMAALPPSVDLRPQCPKEVYDQGQLGSCTANAIAGALEFDQRKQSLKTFTPSRLFIYYNERVMEGTVDSDSGAQIRDGIKSVGNIGACPKYSLK